MKSSIVLLFLLNTIGFAQVLSPSGSETSLAKKMTPGLHCNERKTCEECNAVHFCTFCDNGCVDERTSYDPLKCVNPRKWCSTPVPAAPAVLATAAPTPCPTPEKELHPVAVVGSTGDLEEADSVNVLADPAYTPAAPAATVPASTTSSSAPAKFDSDCDANPCKNGGTCIDKPGVGNYECKCADGFFGKMCGRPARCGRVVCRACKQKKDCKDAVTVGDLGRFSCKCAKKKKKKPVDVVAAAAKAAVAPAAPADNDCVTNPCKNEGTCVDLPGVGLFECKCKAGFTGKLCDTKAAEPRFVELSDADAAEEEGEEEGEGELTDEELSSVDSAISNAEDVQLSQVQQVLDEAEQTEQDIAQSDDAELDQLNADAA